MNNNDLIVIPLGTVSPYCKDEKNCPGFLINNGDKKILLDCGSGITRLLNMPDDLNDLIIIISHLHKDHYSDISSIAYASYVYKKFCYLNDRIKVYIPKGDKRKVQENYKDSDGWYVGRYVEKDSIDFEYLMNFEKDNYLEFIPYNYKDIIKHGNIKISFIENPHQLITHSIKIEVDDNVIVYSSDTGYEKNKLNTFSKDADLLICESTFLKGQYKKDDYHLYAYEAALIAKHANVKQLMLTHFWPGIDKQKYVLEAREIFENTIAAEEGKKLVLRRN